MTTPARLTFLASVLVCLAFCGMFLFRPAPTPREETWAPTDLSVPGYRSDPDRLASEVRTLPDPFRPRFFEQARFRGLAKNPTGAYSAIFQGQGREVVQLPVGQTLDGITLVEADGRKCRMLVGSTSREFSLRKD